LLDQEQDWIEKYRAAIVQTPPSRRLRLAAALNSLARSLGFALGRTSGKLQSPSRHPASGEHKIHQQSDPGKSMGEKDIGKIAADQHQGKKAS